MTWVTAKKGEPGKSLQSRTILPDGHHGKLSFLILPRAALMETVKSLTKLIL